jgi:ubiquinone/menaquinone biosynthesis C-methylase UbiE
MGDYATAGDLWATVGERLVEDMGVAGLDVLDVATGTGMTAITAAWAGGRVTAIDVTPELLAIARARAERAGMTIRWITADMQAMPLGGRRIRSRAVDVRCDVHDLASGHGA